MNPKPKDQNDHSKFEEEKSEEFLNFEKGIDHLLSMPKAEVERVKKAVPVKKRKRKTPTS